MRKMKNIEGDREDTYYGQWFLCVEGVIFMFERYFYDSALVKKHKYWPTGIYGD